MTTKAARTKPMWDSLRRRDALEQAERRDRRVERRSNSTKKEKRDVEQ